MEPKIVRSVFDNKRNRTYIIHEDTRMKTLTVCTYINSLNSDTLFTCQSLQDIVVVQRKKKKPKNQIQKSHRRTVF